MCVAHGKNISDWLKNDETWDLVTALAKDLRIKINSDLNPNSAKTRVSATYPDLVASKRGSPETGGGVWLHPDLAIQLGQWCNPFFAIQVSRWVREWITAAEEQRRKQKLIEACVSETASRWEKRFGDEFMKELSINYSEDLSINYSDLSNLDLAGVSAAYPDLVTSKQKPQKWQFSIYKSFGISSFAQASIETLFWGIGRSGLHFSEREQRKKSGVSSGIIYSTAGA